MPEFSSLQHRVGRFLHFEVFVQFVRLHTSYEILLWIQLLILEGLSIIVVILLTSNTTHAYMRRNTTQHDCVWYMNSLISCVKCRPRKFRTQNPRFIIRYHFRYIIRMNKVEISMLCWEGRRFTRPDNLLYYFLPPVCRWSRVKYSNVSTLSDFVQKKLWAWIVVIIIVRYWLLMPIYFFYLLADFQMAFIGDIFEIIVTRRRPRYFANRKRPRGGGLMQPPLDFCLPVRIFWKYFSWVCFRGQGIQRW